MRAFGVLLFDAGAVLDLPRQHRIPLTWLIEHGSEAIRVRTLRDLAPPGFASADLIEQAHLALAESKMVTAITKKQKEATGVWGGNMLALAPLATAGLKDIGTLPQYRRLVQLGLPSSARSFRLADRSLFRLLSRDEDPTLLFEYSKPDKNGKRDEGVDIWARQLLREAATATLAENGYVEDPRIRGAAHRIANDISVFLRSPLAEKPFVKQGANIVLHPEAHPPTWYSVAMIAAMPNLRRERSGFTERLGLYLAQPAPKKSFALQVGKKTVKPQFLMLGDPLEADAKGMTKDVPLALHFIELLARMGALESAPVATRVLARLANECDDRGVWLPKGLRGAPKTVNKISYHMYPLHPDTKAPTSRSVDITFRVALIAKLLGWELTYS